MIRRVTIAPNVYEFEFNDFSCKLLVSVRNRNCYIIKNRQLCQGVHELVDNVAITIPDMDVNNVTVNRINQVVDTEIQTKRRVLFFG